MIENQYKYGCNTCLLKGIDASFRTVPALTVHMQQYHSKPPKVELVVGQAFQLDKQKPTIVLVDPQYADADIVDESIRAVLGHDSVMVMPLPPTAIKFYQVDGEVVVGA